MTIVFCVPSLTCSSSDFCDRTAAETLSRSAMRPEPLLRILETDLHRRVTPPQREEHPPDHPPDQQEQPGNQSQQRRAEVDVAGLLTDPLERNTVEDTRHAVPLRRWPMLGRLERLPAHTGHQSRPRLGRC